MGESNCNNDFCEIDFEDIDFNALTPEQQSELSNGKEETE